MRAGRYVRAAGWAALAVLLAAGVWFGVRHFRNDQARAVSAVRRAGGTFATAPDEPGRPVVEIDLHGTEGADAVLAQLGDLPRLRKLNLGGTDVTDEGLAPLARLTGLEELNLSTTRVDDAGLAHLAGLVRLRELGLGGTRVSDAGLVHLRGLVRLERINLAATRVTDAGVRQLRAALPRLEVQHFPRPPERP